MALVDLSATTDDNLLNTEEIEELIEDDLKYRDRQLKRLRDEVLDLEDFTETVALTDFTLDDFRADLNRYIEANRQLLHDSPLGPVRSGADRPGASDHPPGGCVLPETNR